MSTDAPDTWLTRAIARRLAEDDGERTVTGARFNSSM
jgi:hypothetical protein